LQAHIAELNLLCEQWAECLPVSRRPEAIVSLPEVLRRNDRLRSLIRK
jgi:hypothetical protein